MNRLINEDCSYPGIYMAKVIPDGSDVRVYVPGIMTFTQEISLLPKALWCAYNLESTIIENIVEPMMVMFEGGDVKRPVIISYTVVGGAGEDSLGGDDTGDSGNSNSVYSGQGQGSLAKAIETFYTEIFGSRYSQGREPGTFDCSSGVSHALYKAGILPHDGNYYSTANMYSEYLAAGFKDVTSSVGTSSYDKLQDGDVLLSSGHTAMYLGNGKISGANSSKGNREINFYSFATKVLRYGGN